MNKYFKILIWPIALVPLIYLGIIWKSLPEKVAIHFDLQGNPDRYGNKTELLLMIAIFSVMSIGLFFILSNIYRIDPKKYATENKDRLDTDGFCNKHFYVGYVLFYYLQFS